MSDGKRTLGFYLLAGFFGVYVLFLYGQTITIAVLSFQGPNGGLTFPMNGHSLHWFANLFTCSMTLSRQHNVPGSYIEVASNLDCVKSSLDKRLHFATVRRKIHR